MMGCFNNHWVFLPNMGQINDIHDALLKPMFEIQALFYLYKNNNWMLSSMRRDEV